MFLLKKLTALFFVLAINTLSVSAEDLSKISEETFKDNVEVLSSPIKDLIKPKSLMSTELSESAAKIPNAKVLDASLHKNKSDSSISKVGLFTPIDSLKKHPGSIVLSLKDAIIRALSNNVSIAVESFNSKVKKETIIDSLSEF
ncbi:MAG: TolC family protein, partial [Nitrospina sp.]|nr:TolC family protein [Nitrospina sp.]